MAGMALESFQEFETAIEIYKQALETKPKHPFLLSKLATLNARVHNFEVRFITKKQTILFAFIGCHRVLDQSNSFFEIPILFSGAIGHSFYRAGTPQTSRRHSFEGRTQSLDSKRTNPID